MRAVLGLALALPLVVAAGEAEVLDGTFRELSKTFADQGCGTAVPLWRNAVASDDEDRRHAALLAVAPARNRVCLTEPDDRRTMMTGIMVMAMGAGQTSRYHGRQALEEIFGADWAETLATTGEPSFMLAAAEMHFVCAGLADHRLPLDKVAGSTGLAERCAAQRAVNEPVFERAFHWYLAALAIEDWRGRPTKVFPGLDLGERFVDIHWRDDLTDRWAAIYGDELTAIRTPGSWSILNRLWIGDLVTHYREIDPDMIAAAEQSAAAFRPVPLDISRAFAGN